MDKRIEKLLVTQVNKEFYSAYLYLDIAGHYAVKGLTGFENWFKIQAQEERDHAMLFRQYLLNNGQAVPFSAIDDPSNDYSDSRHPLVAALKHEQAITASINEIYGAALEAKDFRTMQFLDWFIKEQGEEEKNAEDNILKYDLYGADKKALYLIDRELMGRTYAAPSLVL